MENLEQKADEGTLQLGLGIMGFGIALSIVALTNSEIPISASDVYSELVQLYQDFANSPGYRAFMP